MKFSIRLLYLYLFSFIGLIIAVIGSIRLLQLAIKVYIFNGADQYSVSIPAVAPDDKKVPAPDQYETERMKNEVNRQRQREVAEALAMLIVGIPLYKYHWNLLKKEEA